jgi:hypothetical protein
VATGSRQDSTGNKKLKRERGNASCR